MSQENEIVKVAQNGEEQMGTISGHLILIRDRRKAIAELERDVQTSLDAIANLTAESRTRFARLAEEVVNAS